jgi:hypothetical protein
MRLFRPSIIIVAFSALTTMLGCAPLAITALGVGGSAGMTHAMNGVTYRTFTAPMVNVRTAVLQALTGMGIKIDSSGRQDEVEVIKAATSEREILIELEPISANTTRMRSVAKKSVFIYDSATASEIIQQTEKFLLKPQQRANGHDELASRLW